MDEKPPDAVPPLQPQYTRIVTGVFVAVGVIVIAGVLLSSVSKVREPANRARSSSNIRQISIALMNYETNFSHYPTVCDHGPGSPSGFGVQSLHFQILPYIEGNFVYQLYQQERPQSYYDATNGSARSICRQYMSPSDPTAPDGETRDMRVTVPDAKAPFASNFNGAYATASYVVNGMIFAHDESGKPPTRNQVSDGLSNTIAVSERFQVCQTGQKTVPTLWGMGAYSATTASFALAAPAEAHPHTPAYPLQQYVPMGPIPPGEWATFQINPKPGTCDPTIMQTPHKGGMLVALADGSGRSINPSMPARTFWAGVTPAGNEVFGTDW